MPYDGNNENESKIKTYEYDSLGRLTNECIVEAAGTPLNSSYTYDSFGNRVQKVENRPDDSITTTINYQYDLNNRLIHEDSEIYNEEYNTGSSSATQYYYDDNGNMLAEQKKTYTTGNESSNMSLSGRIGGGSIKLYKYDMLNRLIRYNDGQTEATYTYGADNLRASKMVNGTKTDFVWNDQNLAGETKNGTINTYTYDMTGVHIANQNGTVTSYLKDYHGNVVAKANESGSMIDEIGNRRDYDAFGNQWRGTTSDPFGYCGEYYDNESGLIYLRNRYYDSNTGRFINEDPAKDGLNWYVYCENNPVMFVDPSGYLREPGWVDGVWYENPDAAEFGEGSTVYNALITLGDMWQIRPGDRYTIADLANRVRNAARVWGFEKKLAIVDMFIDPSANDTDKVLAAGNSTKAFSGYDAMTIAKNVADTLYRQEDGDGTAYNAFKHAYWNALMVLYQDEDYAKQTAFSHEFGARENLNQDSTQQALLDMDIYNNAVGRDIAITYLNSLSTWDYYTANHEAELAKIVKNNLEQGLLVIVY